MAKFCSIGLLPAPLPSFPAHKHSTWEIVLYTHGWGTITVGNCVVCFEPGTIVCLPPQIKHFEVSKSGYRNIYMHASDYHATTGVAVFHDSSEQPFLALALLLHREYHAQSAEWPLVTQQLFDLLLLYLARWRTSSGAHPLVEQLKRAMIENFADLSFDLSETVGKLPISSDHLRKLFLASTGRTPLDYLLQLRVNAARSLLRTGELAIKEVAYRVGYSDPYYFSRVFKKVSGVSPQCFRTRNES